MNRFLKWPLKCCISYIQKPRGSHGTFEAKRLCERIPPSPSGDRPEGSGDLFARCSPRFVKPGYTVSHIIISYIYISYIYICMYVCMNNLAVICL